MEPKSTHWSDYIYYILIGVLSFASLCFLPMLNSELGLEWAFPSTAAGWFVWSITKGLGALVNILLFHLFTCQGRANVGKNERYIEARRILTQYHPKEYAPRSERRWKVETYGKKGATVFITTFAAGIGLTMCILQFDLAIFLSYIFTIGLGALFGFLQQKSTEEFYTGEFYDYAQKIKSEVKPNDSQQQTLPQS